MHLLHHNRVIIFSELIKIISSYFLTGLVFFMFSVVMKFILRICTIVNTYNKLYHKSDILYLLYN